MDDLKSKIIELSIFLKERKNNSFSFFENLANELETNPSEVLEKILHSYAITQYADFNTTEERIFDEIWRLSKKMKENEK